MSIYSLLINLVIIVLCFSNEFNMEAMYLQKISLHSILSFYKEMGQLY